MAKIAEWDTVNLISSISVQPNSIVTTLKKIKKLDYFLKLKKDTKCGQNCRKWFSILTFKLSILGYRLICKVLAQFNYHRNLEIQLVLLIESILVFQMSIAFLLDKEIYIEV
ncbi:unnamed protein product [Blepharisma stoltei]|uniref:Uncharacterized protein n=1 Tax=Blepharisma stoltei TaxID=1481888 RepID=A0AAU9JJU1_9CILI|nr:unnamed protein product [Blepharisma stoltei]